jgi:hypothetical protein
MTDKINKIVDIQTGALAVLTDTIEKLNSLEVNYIVIGGWCPYLRYKGSHPGTRDVDVLFADADKKFFLESAVKNFLDDGYLLSAKHDFQLLKQFKIGKQEYVFNIDLLHPSMTRENPELFVDHFVLDICDNQEYEIKKKALSFVLPSSRILFERQFYNIVDVRGVDFNGDNKAIKFPLLDEEGFMLSKVDSVKSAKRVRDSFDIYLIITKYEGDWHRLRDVITRNDYNVSLLFQKLKDYLSNRDCQDIFDNNVRKIYKNINKECTEEFPHKAVIARIDYLLGA